MRPLTDYLPDFGTQKPTNESRIRRLEIAVNALAKDQITPSERRLLERLRHSE